MDDANPLHIVPIPNLCFCNFCVLIHSLSGLSLLCSRNKDVAQFSSILFAKGTEEYRNQEIGCRKSGDRPRTRTKKIPDTWIDNTVRQCIVRSLWSDEYQCVESFIKSLME